MNSKGFKCIDANDAVHNFWNVIGDKGDWITVMEVEFECAFCLYMESVVLTGCNVWHSEVISDVV